MEQQSQVETLDSSSSNDQSSDPSLSRNSSFSRLNAQAPEFVPTRNSPSNQSTPQVQVQVPQPPRVVMPPPPAAAMIHPPPTPSPHQVYSPHGTGAFHVIPVHHQIHHQHHVPVQNYHHQQQHLRNHNHHHRNQNYHHGNNSNHQNHPHEDQQDGELPVVKDKKERKDNQHGGLNDESIQKVLNQVEYYFSDLNLATTDHLIRYILKDPEGYVPISTVASFKKIKAVISSHSHLAGVLRKSLKLVVSEDGKKVKRQNPLTELDLEELQSRVVVAENLPDDHCHQNLMKIFSAVGSVKSIRTCLPQTSGGGASSASRSAKTEGMLFSNKLHAFVEYESIELAEKAIAELNDEGNWRSGLRVRLMLKHGGKGKKGHDGEWQYDEEDTSTSELHAHEKQPDDPSQQNDVHSHELTGEEHYNDKEGGQRKGRNKGRGKGRGRNDRGQYHHNSHHSNNHNSHQNNRGHHVGTPPSNNMVNNEQPMIGKQPPGPRMPDGTRGFTMGRGKPVAVSTA